MKINIPEIVEPYLPYAAAVVLIFIFIFMALWIWGLLVEVIESRDEERNQHPNTPEEETKATMKRLEKAIKAKIEETRKDWS